jgi:hypothetical protein
MWDLKLGRTVGKIRGGGQYSKYKEDLIALEFDFSRQYQGHGWVATKLALETYMSINSNLQVPFIFKVPHSSRDWSKVTWGIPLGSSVRNIRRNLSYVEHRDELIQIGFDFSKII